MEYRKLIDLKELPGNPRTIKDAQFEILCKSIADNKEYFEARPLILSDRTRELIILAGNQRYKAAKHLNLKEVPTYLLRGLTEEKEREITIRDNINNGEWQWDTLANEWDVDKLTEWGLEIPDFAIKGEAEEDDYEIPDTIETDIVTGDLFEIGQHRLLCGDSTKGDDVTKVLNEKEPYLMVTDPPYGVNYDASWRVEAGVAERSFNKGKVKNDNNADWTEAWALSPSKVAYVWHAGVYSGIVSESLAKCNFILRTQIIWNKDLAVFGRGDYHWKHEPCWHAVKKGFKGNWAGDRKQKTVWDIPTIHSFKNGKNAEEWSLTGHGTQKPVACMSNCMSNHDGDVYDPFLGSGTTMVAAHQLNRKCYGIEIDPKYCQVILDRMQKLDPSLEIKRNGVVYQGSNCESTAN